MTLKEETLEKVQSWISFNNLEIKRFSRHFYLQGDLLDDFSKYIVSNAKSTVVVSNPFVERCSLSDSLIESSKKGIKVTLVTRPIYSNDRYYGEKTDYHESLKASNVMIAYHDTVHAKIIIVDNCIAVISSLNFTSSSSSGRAWEAGIVSIEPSVVNNVGTSLDSILESRDTQHQNPRVHIELEETIYKHPSVIFSYLTEPRLIPLWNDLIERVEPSSLPLQKGSKRTIHLRNFKTYQESFVEFVEDEKISVLSFNEGRLSVGKWELFPTDSGTLVRTTQGYVKPATTMSGDQWDAVQKITESLIKKTMKQLHQVVSSHVG